MKSQGLQVSLKASYGLSSDWDLYGRAGVMGYRAESDIRGHNDFDTGIRPVLAVGTEYAFNENWAGRLEYQWVSNVFYPWVSGCSEIFTRCKPVKLCSFK